MKIYINGRFLTQRITGVQRYALEITRALDSLISDDKNLQKHEYIVIAPKKVLYFIKLNNLLKDAGAKRVWIHPSEKCDKKANMSEPIQSIRECLIVIEC